MTDPLPYIEQLGRLVATNKPFVAVTLVDAIGSTPQDTGTKMLVTSKGLFFGTVGGGRIEHQAIEHAQQMLMGQAKHRELVEWNLQRDVGMTCGGVVTLYFEGYNLDDWHIVIFGAGHVAQALVKCLLLLDCRITCIDSRAEWLEKLPRADRLTVVHDKEPRAYVENIRQQDYVVCMTMGHNTDLPVLEAIFGKELELAYLGVIGSRSKRGVLIRDLVEKGFAKDDIDHRFHCPIGLPIGTNQPAEIAISIIAQMLQTRGSKTPS